MLFATGFEYENIDLKFLKQKTREAFKNSTEVTYTKENTLDYLTESKDNMGSKKSIALEIDNSQQSIIIDTTHKVNTSEVNNSTDIQRIDRYSSDVLNLTFQSKDISFFPEKIILGLPKFKNLKIIENIINCKNIEVEIRTSKPGKHKIELNIALNSYNYKDKFEFEIYSLEYPITPKRSAPINLVGETGQAVPINLVNYANYPKVYTSEQACPINLVGETGQAVQISIHAPSQYICANCERILPDWKRQPFLRVVIVLQQSRYELVEKTAKIEAEKEHLRDKFMRFGCDLAFNLRDRGYLTDLIDPRTGYPLLSHPGVIPHDDIAVVKALLNYPVIKQKQYSLLVHPDWGTAVYPSIIISEAPPILIEWLIKGIGSMHGLKESD